MNYSGYYKFDTSNGEGVRCTLFCSGCSIKCPDCWNKETWKFSYGKPYTQEFEDQILQDLSHPYVQGLSLLGGNPSEQRNIQTITNLCKRVRKGLPEKDIWCWTGHEFEYLKNNLLYVDFLDNIDVLIDGKFVKELYSPNLKWKGSANQRVIDVKKSLAQNEIVLYDA